MSDKGPERRTRRGREPRIHVHIGSVEGSLTTPARLKVGQKRPEPAPTEIPITAEDEDSATALPRRLGRMLTRGRVMKRYLPKDYEREFADKAAQAVGESPADVLIGDAVAAPVMPPELVEALEALGDEEPKPRTDYEG